MTTEQKGKRKQPVPLTAAQERASRFVVAALKNSSQKSLVIVDGFSGVGKSTVLDEIENTINLHGGIVADTDEAIFQADRLQHRHQGHIVTTTIPYELAFFREYSKDSYAEFQITTHVLPGMTAEEIFSYIGGLPNASGLTLEQISQFSLGIPLLAQRLTMPGVTEPIAAQIAAGFVGRNFRRNYFNEGIINRINNSYLRMPIPDLALHAMEELGASLTAQRIYTELNNALEVQAELQKKGIVEDSPLFVAPESEQIYDEMMKSNGRASIDIFVPDLTAEELTRIQKALGFSEGWYDYDNHRATRARMFKADYRKTVFWHKDDQGDEFRDTRLDDHLLRRIPKMFEAYRKGRLGLVPADKESLISFAMHCHEHHGMTFHPAYHGWMLESLLQQRGISYYVDNDTNGSSYFYDPESKQIKVLPERPKIRAY